MNLCEDGHEEVCFEGKNCPACELDEELREEIEIKNEKIDLDEEIIKGVR